MSKKQNKKHLRGKGQPACTADGTESNIIQFPSGKLRLERFRDGRYHGTPQELKEMISKMREPHRTEAHRWRNNTNISEDLRALRVAHIRSKEILLGFEANVSNDEKKYTSQQKMLPSIVWKNGNSPQKLSSTASLSGPRRV